MHRKDYRLYQTSIVPITSTISKNADCNTLTFLNQGTQNVVINGQLTLTPGMGYTFEGYPGEMNTTAYDIVFANDGMPGAFMLMIMKIYL